MKMHISKNPNIFPFLFFILGCALLCQATKKLNEVKNGGDHHPSSKHQIERIKGQKHHPCRADFQKMVENACRPHSPMNEKSAPIKREKSETMKKHGNWRKVVKKLKNIGVKQLRRVSKCFGMGGEGGKKCHENVYKNSEGKEFGIVKAKERKPKAAAKTPRQKVRPITTVQTRDLDLPQNPERTCPEQFAAIQSSSISPLCYPNDFVTQVRNESVVDEYMDKNTVVKVLDPYRVLEQEDAPETHEFIDLLNGISQGYLEANEEFRQKVKDQYTKMLTRERVTTPIKHGQYFYYWHNTGLQTYDVWYRRLPDADGGLAAVDPAKDEMFLDPNTFSPEQTDPLITVWWSNDAQLIAYVISPKGSDRLIVKFKRVSDGTDLPDQLINIKSDAYPWIPDNSGIFYTTYQSLQEMTDPTDLNVRDVNHTIYFHKLGTPQSEDIVIAGGNDEQAWLSQQVHNFFLFVYLPDGVFYLDLRTFKNFEITQNPQMFADTLGLAAAIRYEEDGSSALILDYPENLPGFTLKRIPTEPNSLVVTETLWAEGVFVEDNSVEKIEQWASIVDSDKLVVCYLENVKHTLYVHSLTSGALLFRIPLEIGTISQTWIDTNTGWFFFDLASFLNPLTIYKIEFTNEDGLPSFKMEIFRQTALNGLETSKMVQKQVEYSGKDGQKIPMFIVHNEGIKMDGTNPLWMYGYGAAGLSQLPWFSNFYLMFVQNMGGIFALPNIRGGGEFGEAWHQAGMLDKKQNTFDDFIAAAEYLVANKFTNPAEIVIEGSSNGGLLTAVCAQQRPDLFKAVLTGYGMLEMLRFGEFAMGYLSYSEFGDPKNADQFGYIYKYSPLHNIRIPIGLKSQWPAHFITTADHDDRVPALHSLKYAATLYYKIYTEAVEKQQNPLLVRVYKDSGHAGGNSMMDTTADTFAFVQRALNLEWTDFNGDA